MLSLCARLARQHGASRLTRRLTSRAGPSDAALRGMEMVLGKSPNYLETLRREFHPQKCHPLDRGVWKTMESWAGITKGRDIFIPGLPAFDIMQAYASLVPSVSARRTCPQPGRVEDACVYWAGLLA